MNANIDIRTTAALAALEVLETLGLTSGEISRNQALKVYGRQFRDLEAAGLIRPVRDGGGRYGHKWFRVADILAARAEQQRKAEIQAAFVEKTN